MPGPGAIDRLAVGAEPLAHSRQSVEEYGRDEAVRGRADVHDEGAVPGGGGDEGP